MAIDTTDTTEQCDFCGRFRFDLIYDGGLGFCNDSHADKFWDQQMTDEANIDRDIEAEGLEDNVDLL